MSSYVPPWPGEAYAQTRGRIGLGSSRSSGPTAVGCWYHHPFCISQNSPEFCSFTYGRQADSVPENQRSSDTPEKSQNTLRHWKLMGNCAWVGIKLLFEASLNIRQRDCGSGIEVNLGVSQSHWGNCRKRRIQECIPIDNVIFIT